MTQKIKYLLFACLIVLLFAGAGPAYAASIFDIEFPIAELGGCADRAACKAYCDDTANGQACLAFARKFGLVDEKTAAKAQAVQTAGGPGGCRGVDECKAYCDAEEHQDECIDYAVKNGFMTREDAARAQKPGPGGCRGAACQSYCADPLHQEECLAFAEKNGFIKKDEARRIKGLQEVRSGPGGCAGSDQCRAYCDDPVHIDECVSFAQERGFVDKERAQAIKKTLGAGPGGCRGKDACRAYCEDSSHQTECIDFAVKNGFMTREDAERAQKFAGRTGPGGCQGEQCRDFCNQPENGEACFAFAEREGFIPKEEAARAKKFMAASREGGPGGCRGTQCRDYCADPSHHQECFDFAKKESLITKEEEQQFEAGSKIQEVVKSSGGPGGCRSDEECRAYCTDPSRVEECVAFGAAHGGVPPEQARAMLKQFTSQRLEARGGADEFGAKGFENFSRAQEGASQRFEEFRQLEEQFRGKLPGSGGFPGGRPGEFPGRGTEGFPGKPEEFPGGPGGNAGGSPGSTGASSFAGPGGCTSPAECIKYCTEHKEECFGASDQQSSGGERGRGKGGQREECCPAPGGAPRLRSNLIHNFQEGQLPPDFQQLPQEEREKLFHDKFPQFNPPSPGQFPDRGESRGGQGVPPGGRPGEFPGRGTEGFPGKPEEFPGGPGASSGRPPEGSSEGQGQGHEGALRPAGAASRDRMMPESGVHPPAGMFSRPPEGTVRPQEGTSGQPSSSGSGTFIRPQSGSFSQHTPLSPSSGETLGAPPPSGGSMPSSGGSMPPPPSGSMPSSGGSMPPPPSGSMPSSGGSMPPPHSGFAPITNFFGAIIQGLMR